MMKQFLFLLTIMLASSTLFSAQLQASDAFPAPRQPAPNNGEGLLMQHWIINAYSADGGSLRVVFELANFKENERLKEMTGQSIKSTGAHITAEFTSADGKRKSVEQSAGGDWSFSADRQLLGMASSSLKRVKSQFKLDFESDDLRIEVALKPLDGPWKPGGEKPLLGNINSRYFDVVLFAPRAQVKGVVKLREFGQTVEKSFSGNAVLMYETTNMRPSELMKRRMDVCYFDDKNTVIFGGLAQPAKLNGLSHSWLYVKSAGAAAFTSVKNSVKFGKQIKGEFYPVPQSIAIKAGALNLELRNANIVRRIESMDQRENIHGFIARQFSKPVEYELECVAAMDGKNAPADLKSFKPRCSMLYLNK